MSILLIDLHQIFFSTLMTQLFGRKDVPLDENLYRHMVLNTIRANRVKFKEYDQVVIATDAKSWRKDVFPFYKANRKTDRDKSGFDWNEIFASLHKIREEIKANFPYRVIYVEGAEADDIISYVARYEASEKVMIVSGDKDFVQLQMIPGVQQYDPIRKKFISENNPGEYLLDHVLRGDSGDGIPNALSDDDTFVNESKRQIPLTKKKLNELKNRIDKENIPFYTRNLELIDLTMTPEIICGDILAAYRAEEGKDRKKLFNYFVEHRLSNLMQNIQEF